MKTLILLAAVGVVVQAATDPIPQKCCTDHQFGAVVGVFGSSVYPLTENAVFIDEYNLIAYDYYRKRIGMEVHRRQPDGSEQIIRSLMDYAGQKLYSFQNNLCTITPLNEAMESPCIPDNETFLGTSMYGYGAETLAVNLWEYKKPGPDGDTVIKRAVTAKGCVPVIIAYYGNINKGFLGSRGLICQIS